MIIGPFALLCLLALMFRPVRQLVGFLFVLAFIGLVWMCSVPAHAATPAVDCSEPPYGDTMDRYEVFVHTFGTIMPATSILPALCAIKFEHADRAWLYNIGITPHQIESMAVVSLTIKVMTEVRALLRSTPDSDVEAVMTPMQDAINAALAVAKSSAPSATPEPYGILLCIDGAGCRFEDASTVFNGEDDCNRYRRRLFPNVRQQFQTVGNISYSCVPVQYSQFVP